MTDFELVGGVSALAFIIGLLEFFQRIGLHRRYVPVLSLAFGLLVSFGYHYYGSTTWFEALTIGIMLGLCATGVCFGTREMIEAFRKH